MQLYVDLDGCLADFDSAVDKILGHRPDRISRLNSAAWARLAVEATGFYRQLPLLPDALQLWRYVEPHDPIILTGVPISIPQAAEHKRAWVAKHLGPHVRVDCCLSREKFHRAKPGDILIDDWPKYQHLWESAGGIWITHTSALNTIDQLRERGL